VRNIPEAVAKDGFAIVPGVKSEVDAPRRVIHLEYASSMFVGDDLELAIA